MLWQGLWKQRIRYKLGNERKRKEQENETVQQRKRVKTSTAVNDTDVPEGSKQQESPQGTGAYWLPNYSPAMPPGEDNETMEGHVKWLQRAVKIRRKEDEKKVELLIYRTLHMRRKTLFDGDTTMEIFFDTFPFMKNEREIIKEFKRLNGDGKGVEELVSEFLSTYAQALWKHAKMAKHGAGLLSTLLAIKTKNTDHTKYNYLFDCAAVHYGPFQWKPRSCDWHCCARASASSNFHQIHRWWGLP